MIILNLSKNICRCKFFMIIHKNIGSCYHLSIKFSPDSFPPTCIGNGKMKTVTMQIMPETGSYNMSQGYVKSCATILGSPVVPEVKYINEVSSFVLGCSGLTKGAAFSIPL